MLKGLMHAIDTRQGALVSQLAQLEEPSKDALEAYARELEQSSVSRETLKFDEDFNLINQFAHRVTAVGESWLQVLRKLQCSLAVVESMDILYDLGSSIVRNYEQGFHKEGREQAIEYIEAVKSAKTLGHADELFKALNSGHIGQVISDLRAFVILKLGEKISQEDSKLFMRLAVMLRASSDAYKSYLRTIHEDVDSLSPSSLQESGEIGRIESIINSARKLFIRQAQAVYSELGSTEYIRICREIHSVTSSKACDVLEEFLRTNFDKLIIKKDVGVDDLLAQLSAAMEEQQNIVKYIEDMTKVDKLLEDITTITSLWLDYEGSLQDTLAPVYRGLHLKHGADPEFSMDVLGDTTSATRAMQSLLLLYVKLEHTAVTWKLLHAINYDSIDWIVGDDSVVAPTSTLMDDIFFVLQKAQQRAVATGDVRAACETLNQVYGVIQRDLRGVLLKNLMESQAIYSEYLQNPEHLITANWKDMLQKHFMDSDQTLPEALPSRFSFFHCLTNIEDCLHFLVKFKEDVSTVLNNTFRNVEHSDLFIESTLKAMELVLQDYEELLDTSCKYALNTVKVHLTDALNRFNEIDFNITEEVYHSYQTEDPFLDNMLSVLRTIFGHFAKFFPLLSRNRSINSLTERICQFMESAVKDKSFTMYGALYLDNVVRSMLGLASSYDPEAVNHFTTLLLISDVINCSKGEELTQFEGIASPEDIKAYYSLRIDVNNAIVNA